MIRMLGSVFEKGSGAPGLQTGWPVASAAGAPTHVLCQPCSWHVESAGQHVMLLPQQTAFSYGQQPLPFTENLAPHTVPVLQTCAGAGGGAGGSGTAVQFVSRQPEVYAAAPDLGDGRLPALLVFIAQVTGGENV
eukprot:SAG22_NODE_162_length_16848_cov_16.978267_2_plen_135_part_00